MFKFLWAAFTIVSSVAPFSLLAQVSDDFSDGDFTHNPTWFGKDSLFTISSGALKLQAPVAAGTAYLVTENESINNATWEFSVRMDFNPSGSNYARVYLVSDKADLSTALNGYFVTIGDTPDEVSLYRQKGTARTKIIDGKDGIVSASSVSVRVKVTRDDAGNWELFSDAGETGVYLSEGIVNDITHVASAYFGVRCVYTATRSDKFYFDDFVVTGDPWVDNTIPPAVNDVVITEIFADPEPSVGLPESEYIELYNRSINEYNLLNWQLTDGNSIAYLPNRKIAPGQYLILTPLSASSYFTSYGEVVSVDKFPSLNNPGDNIMLKSSEGLTIDSVSYNISWHPSREKKEGGWSLELIDPENSCAEETNWTSSEDVRGGTPGMQNSVFANKPDLTGPALLKVIPLSDTALKILFNEKLHHVTPVSENFLLTPSLGIASVSFADQTLREVYVTLEHELSLRTLYTLKCESIYDCSGNVIQDGLDSFSFALPEKALPGDIVLNEILFNPKPLGVDFIEVYNHSSKFINLKNWALSNAETDSLRNRRVIVTDDLLLEPGHYMVFTTDAATLKGQYTAGIEENFLSTSLPSLPDDEGSVAISDDEGSVLDQYHYSDDMHSPFIKDDEGVSLERVSFTSSSEDPQNWRSGTSSTGYATPGYVNGNSRTTEPTQDDAVLVTPEIFEPIYGQPDFTQITYKFDRAGNVANVKIYDAHGRLVKQLANNDILNAEGFYRWDGDRDDGTKARIGYYFVWFQVFNAEGEVKTFRKRVVVAARF